jgi:peptidoglycan/xylan/chitin deacetylase (PgdA/CDA1 family)
MRRRILPALTSVAAMTLGPVRRRAVPIFMLHRFTHPGRHGGDDPQVLRRRLAALRREGVQLVPLERLVACVRDGEPLPVRAAAFTVDDGYVDFAESGAAAFAEFDCPVTVFVATGFIDRTCWYWWDRVEWAFTHSARRAADVALGEAPVRYVWDSPATARAAASALVVRLEHVRDEEKHAAIARLAADLEVDIPDAVPAEFAPMSWDQIRALGGRGVTFGPHTVTHPILAQTGDTQSAHEIAASWRRLREERTAHVPVFCYPNGSAYAFTMREVATLRREGLAAALTTLHGYVDASSRAAGADAPYLMCRVPYPHDELDFRQITTGLDRAKILLRRAPAQRISAAPAR